MNFSVIMSVYIKDNATFFRTALDSVSTKQLLKPKQIVVVEDGPVPAEIERVFHEIENLNPSIEFNLIKKPTNEGLASALNTAIDSCKYEWIARMDSDDYSVPERFKKQFGFIKDHPEISVLGGSMREFKYEIGDIDSTRIVACDHVGICKMMKVRNPMNHICVCYKKQDVVQCGKYDVSFGKLEDYKLWVDMLGKGYKFANIPDVCCYARIGNGFISRRSNKREISDWDALQHYLIIQKVISKREALRNKIYIRVFIYMPGWMKTIIYKVFLRKKQTGKE